MKIQNILSSCAWDFLSDFMVRIFFFQLIIKTVTAGPDSSVGCMSAWFSDSCGLESGTEKHSFVEIAHEMISTVILSLPLIQVGQLSVTGERMCTIIKYCLTAYVSLPRKRVVRIWT